MSDPVWHQHGGWHHHDDPEHPEADHHHGVDCQREIDRLRRQPHRIEPDSLHGPDSFRHGLCGFCRRPIYESADYRGGRFRHAADAMERAVGL